MISYHKPKVHRSSIGCCICKTKSSSSRFADSHKYDSDFIECFQLTSQRYGEICNACVLIVKRFQKMPAGSKRNWAHLVDARGGPGMKFRHKKRIYANSKNTSPNAKNDPDEISLNDLSIEKDEGAHCDIDLNSPVSVNEPMDREVPNVAGNIKPRRILNKRKFYTPTKWTGEFTDTVVILDTDYWQRKEVCCGIIWTHPSCLVALDSQYYKPCKLNHFRSKNAPAEMQAAAAPVKPFNDCSMDSGYESPASHLVQVEAPPADPPKVVNKSKQFIIQDTEGKKRFIIIKKIIPGKKKRLCTDNPVPIKQA